MDAFAQLALMAKAKRVFESSDTFLSFPVLSPITFRPDELRFGDAASMTSQDLMEASAFSRIANQLPRSIIAPRDESEYVWDIYRDVLQSARVASGTMTGGEKVAYDAAIALLYTSGEGGLRTDSERLTTYKQHRDAVFEAEEEYKNQKLTAEAATDQAAQDQWKNVDEPRLRQLVQERKDAWAKAGLKAEVEAAQQIETAGAATAASTVWAEWRGLFVDDLDLLTDPNQIRFAMTGYSPTDIVEVDNWPRFTLSREEMSQLADQAPPELRDVFAAGSHVSEIESLSFEYRSIAVVRPWFRPALFKARFWRLAEGTEPLSDGSEPPNGRLPAYVSAMVFARNVVVKYKESSGGASEQSASGPSLLRLDRSMINPGLTHLLLRAEPQLIEPIEVAPSPEIVQPIAPDLTRAVLRLRSASFAGARVSPMTFGLVASRTVPSAGLRLRTLVSRPILADVMATSVSAAPSAPAEPSPAPVPEAVGQPDSSRDIIVLAYICRRLPRSPDPDPDLAWA